MEEWKQNGILVLIGVIFLYLVYKTTTEKENFGEITKWKKELREENEISNEDYRKMALKKQKKEMTWNQTQWENQSQWQNNRMIDDIKILKSISK